MPSIVRTVTLVTFLGVATALGCDGDNPEDNNSGNCQTDVTSITYPAAGNATLHGSFFQTETVIIEETDGSIVAQGTPSTDRNAFTLDGIPSGTHTYKIIVSCDSGQENLGNFTFTAG